MGEGNIFKKREKATGPVNATRTVTVNLWRNVQSWARVGGHNLTFIYIKGQRKTFYGVGEGCLLQFNIYTQYNR